MRRLNFEDPYSQAAIWSRRLALFALLVAGIGILAGRGGLDLTAVFAVLGAAFVVVVLAILFGLVGAIIIWRTGHRGAGAGFTGIILAILSLAYPAYLAYQAHSLPALRDISTDIEDPPAFSRTRRAFAARDEKIPSSLPRADRNPQSAAYPQVQPITLDLDAEEAYRAVLKTVALEKWRIIDQTPPHGRMGIGHVDAIARSPILASPEDVTIRLRPLAGQTRIDIRSVSRFGRTDFGGNARRIELFSNDLQTLAEAK